MKKDEDRTVVVCGVKCTVKRLRFEDGKMRDLYTFTVPGWEECRVTGIAAAKRVIKARLSPGVQYLYGIHTF